MAYRYLKTLKCSYFLNNNGTRHPGPVVGTVSNPVRPALTSTGEFVLADSPPPSGQRPSPVKLPQSVRTSVRPLPQSLWPVVGAGGAGLWTQEERCVPSVPLLPSPPPPLLLLRLPRHHVVLLLHSMAIRTEISTYPLEVIDSRGSKFNESGEPEVGDV